MNKLSDGTSYDTEAADWLRASIDVITLERVEEMLDERCKNCGAEHKGVEAYIAASEGC